MNRRSSVLSRGSGSIEGNSTSNKQYEQIYMQKQEEEKRREDDLREEVLADLNKKGDTASQMILMAKYKTDERLNVLKEFDFPPSKIFVSLGADEDKDMFEHDPENPEQIPKRQQKRKHYRQYFNTELENVKEIFHKKSPFNTIEIKRG